MGPTPARPRKPMNVQPARAEDLSAHGSVREGVRHLVRPGAILAHTDNISTPLDDNSLIDDLVEIQELAEKEATPTLEQAGTPIEPPSGPPNG